MAPKPGDRRRSGSRINQPRIDWGEADALIVGDLVVGCAVDSIGTVRAGFTFRSLPTAMSPRWPNSRATQTSIREELLQKLRHALGSGRLMLLDAHAMAQQQFGDTVGVNMILIGYAWQLGLIPVSEAAVTQAIALSGVAVENNRRAFACGRVLAARAQAGARTALALAPPEHWQSLTMRRAAELFQYQNAAYAAQYREAVEACATVEQKLIGAGSDLRLTRAVASNLFKLMAYKDEYEVARLYSQPEFAAALAQQFDGDFALHVHLAPPILARPRPGEKSPQKIVFGPWMMRALPILARLRFLRGTPFDPFGYQEERRIERDLILSYRSTIDLALASLSPATLDVAVRLASLPQRIRGYGHVKAASIKAARREQEIMMRQLASQADPQSSSAIRC